MSELMPLPPIRERLASAYGFDYGPNVDDKAREHYVAMCTEFRADALDRFAGLDIHPTSERARHWIRYDVATAPFQPGDRALNTGRVVILMAESRYSATRPIFRLIVNDTFLHRVEDKAVEVVQAEDFSLADPYEVMYRLGMFDRIGRIAGKGGPVINQINDMLDIRGYLPHTPESRLTALMQTDPLGQPHNVAAYPFGHPHDNWGKLAAITVGRKLLDETALHIPTKGYTDFVQH